MTTTSLVHEKATVRSQNITMSQREKSTMRNTKMQSMNSIVASVFPAMRRPRAWVVSSDERRS